MNLIKNLQKPLWLFIIGILMILIATFLKLTALMLLFQMPMFVIGLLLESVALILFLKKQVVH